MKVSIEIPRTVRDRKQKTHSLSDDSVTVLSPAPNVVLSASERVCSVWIGSVTASRSVRGSKRRLLGPVCATASIAGSSKTDTSSTPLPSKRGPTNSCMVCV